MLNAVLPKSSPAPDIEVTESEIWCALSTWRNHYSACEATQEACDRRADFMNRAMRRSFDDGRGEERCVAIESAWRYAFVTLLGSVPGFPKLPDETITSTRERCEELRQQDVTDPLGEQFLTASECHEVSNPRLEELRGGAEDEFLRAVHGLADPIDIASSTDAPVVASSATVVGTGSDREIRANLRNDSPTRVTSVVFGLFCYQRSGAVAPLDDPLHSNYVSVASDSPIRSGGSVDAAWRFPGEDDCEVLIPVVRQVTREGAEPWNGLWRPEVDPRSETQPD